MAKVYLIDLGNSHCAIKEWSALDEDIKTIPTRELSPSSLKFESDARLIISSVVPQNDRLFQPYTTTFVTHKNIPNLQINLKKTQEVGADRLTTALAAYTRMQQSCLVIDSGTAITFCYVDTNGCYQGGNILPGMRIASQALNDYTAKIPLIMVEPETELIGKTTQEAVSKGLYFGYKSMIKGMISEYKTIDPAVKIVGTGNGLSLFQHELDLDCYDPHLVFRGLEICAEALGFKKE